MSPSILIVEDQEIFHETLRNFILRFYPEARFRFALHGREALHLLEEEVPDVVILDFQMKVFNGYDTTIAARKLYPNLRIIILSSFASQQVAIDFFKVGASGFLDKIECSQHLPRCIDTVLAGGYYLYLCGEIDELKVKDMCELHRTLEPLSDREKAILQLICDEKSDKEIAQALDISFRTVQKHHATLLRKTNSLNSVGLAKYAMMHGIID
jgi:two-component system NarL family response regulator